MICPFTLVCKWISWGVQKPAVQHCPILEMLSKLLRVDEIRLDLAQASGTMSVPTGCETRNLGRRAAESAHCAKAVFRAPTLDTMMNELINHNVPCRPGTTDHGHHNNENMPTHAYG